MGRFGGRRLNAFERSLIGCILLDAPFALAACGRAGLRAECFEAAELAAVFGYAAGAMGRGEPVDFITVGDHLRSVGQLEGIGGEEALQEWMDGAPTAAHAEYYAAQVVEGYRRRELVRGTADIRQRLAKGQISAAAAGKELQRLALEQAPVEAGGIIGFEAFRVREIPEPPVIIEGILRAREIGLLAAGSKQKKSWALQALALAASTGGDWLGWQTRAGRVLYINAEISDYNTQARLATLAEKMGVELGGAGNLDVYNVRGTMPTVLGLIPTVLARQAANGEPYSLIIPDPLYCFLGERDENDNSAMAGLMQELGLLAERTGAAIFIAHHFSKGNKADVDHIDRAAGAGAIARYVDTLTTFTAHEQEDHYAVETTARGFAKPESFVAHFEYPLWVRNDALDASALKRAEKRPGRPQKVTPEELVDLLPEEGMKHREWRERAETVFGISARNFNNLIKAAKSNNIVFEGFGLYKKAKEMEIEF